jgi:MFS family permease
VVEGSVTLEDGTVEQTLFRHPRFAKFWAARILSTSAFQIQAVAIGWYLYAMTGRALDLGMLGLAAFIPVAFFSLFAGHFADRHDRRRIVAICQFCSAAVSALLAAGAYAEFLRPASIFALMAVAGTARTFEHPTMAALMPSLVRVSLFPKASALTAAANQMAQIVGPALGGALLILSPVAALGAASCLFVAATLLSWRIGKSRAARVREPIALKSLFSGVAYVKSNPLILGTLSLDLFAVLLGGVTALLPIFAHDILKIGPSGLGFLRAAPPVGALAMSIVLARYPLRHRVGALMFAAVSVFGAATIVFGLSTNLFLSLAALSILGAADVVSVVIRFSLVQLQTPDFMRGRVSALNSLFIGASNQLGDFESGAAAALLGAVPAVLLGGGGTIAVALLWMMLFPELRRLQTLEG